MKEAPRFYMVRTRPNIGWPRSAGPDLPRPNLPFACPRPRSNRLRSDHLLLERLHHGRLRRRIGPIAAAVAPLAACGARQCSFGLRNHQTLVAANVQVLHEVAQGNRPEDGDGGRERSSAPLATLTTPNRTTATLHGHRWLGNVQLCLLQPLRGQRHGEDHLSGRLLRGGDCSGLPGRRRCNRLCEQHIPSGGVHVAEQ